MQNNGTLVIFSDVLNCSVAITAHKQQLRAAQKRTYTHLEEVALQIIRPDLWRETLKRALFLSDCSSVILCAKKESSSEVPLFHLSWITGNPCDDSRVTVMPGIPKQVLKRKHEEGGGWGWYLAGTTHNHQHSPLSTIEATAHHRQNLLP